MKNERPAKQPDCPETPTGDGWMSYGGHRAHCRAMEDWHDEMSHWHQDAKKKGILCYTDCPACEEAIRFGKGNTKREAQSLAQTKTGRDWLGAEVARRLKA